MTASTATGSLTSFDRACEWVRDAGGRLRMAGPHQAYAQCPMHDDRHESLSITYEPEHGRTQVYCHTPTCGARGVEIADAYGHPRSDLYDNPWPKGEKRTDGPARPPRQPRRKPVKAKPAKPAGPACLGQHEKHQVRRITSEPVNRPDQQWHTYHDEQGTEIAWRIRVRCTRCGEKVRVAWRYPGQDGKPGYGATVTAPAEMPLYGLPALREGIREGLPIYITEGETDADAVTTAGGIAGTHGAATNEHGNHWRPWHTNSLTGATEVIVCADRDKAGYRSARYIARQLRDAGIPNVRVVEPIGDAEVNDVRDHLNAGHQLTDLRDITHDILDQDQDPDMDSAPAVHTAEQDQEPERPATNVTDLLTRQPLTPDDPEPEPDPLVVRYVGGTETVFEQRPPTGGRPYPRLVEVHGGGKDKPETLTTILRGTLAVPEVYTLRGIDSLCAPASGAAGDLYRARFETPTGHVFETPITDEELRKTRDLTWPGQLGVSRFTSKQALGRIPDAITAMAIDLPERQAYTATGLLLRPGRIPVYLRQGRPALTGRHGIYDNTAVTMLPGESESLRGVAFLRPPDPSTPEQACDDMLSLFDVLSVTTSDPLVLVLLLSELAYAPWSSLPGFARNAIFLAAPTGLGKTVLSGLVTAWQSDTFVPTVTDSSAVTASVDRMTGAGAAGILSQLRGLLASLDDFFPLGSSARELQRHAELLNVLGRGIKSGSEDAKADRGGALRVGRAMRTPVLATGEKFTDPTLSQSARYIHAELTADVLALKDHAENSPTGRNEALARVQANTADVARAFSALIVDGLGALTDEDADRGPHAAQRWAEDEVGSWRLTGNNHLPPNYIGPMTGTYLIAERAGALGIADPSKVRDEFADHLCRCASEQARRSVSRSAIAERYGDVVAEIVRLIRDLILDGHRFRLDGPTLDTHPDVPGYTLPTFGWREITREYRDSNGTKQVDVISEPLPRFGNPIGTVHTYRPGTGPGRPPAWPTPPTSPVLRVAPDDFRRLYDAATEDATHLPGHGEARDLLAKIGYLRSRN